MTLTPCIANIAVPPYDEFLSYRTFAALLDDKWAYFLLILPVI